MNPANRVELLMDVCAAVQHAHQKGVIHRDLKPSNILVAMDASRPVPKVIDFGIAKAKGQPLTDKTVFTHFQQFLGTPAYMSPEQASLSALDIDTRSDISSLGVLLYELLTGRPPVEANELLSASLDKMRRIIREREPDRPSTRLARERSLLAVRQARGDSHVSQDLDWIVMKALEKDRTRRYETANGLAADIRRLLSHDPVLAGPPGVGYRLRKFVRRNRTVVGAASLVLTVLVLGIVGTSHGLVRAWHEQDRQTEEARKAKIELGKAEAARDFLLQEIILAALPFYEDLIVILRKLAAPELAAGRVEEAGGKLALSLHNYGDLLIDLRREAEAEVAAREAPELWRRQGGPVSEAVATATYSLADLMVRRKNAPEAERLYRETLAIRRLTKKPGDPPIVPQRLLRPHQLRPRRIQMHILADRSQITAARTIHDQRLVPATEPPDENGWASDNTHAHATAPRTRFPQRRHKPMPILVVLENRLPPVAPVHHACPAQAPSDGG